MGYGLIGSNPSTSAKTTTIKENMFFISKKKLREFIGSEASIKLDDRISQLEYETRIVLNNGRMYTTCDLRSLIGEEVKAQLEDIKFAALEEIKKESFVDSIIERINKKQLK